ncbi:hypothetical protein RND71_018620 [Anisodus tanguticus]|uniref:Response regulatory domain-containing protein n=1 Tax=Anisodus tanguticus TaxID=243964 RepID=A0AAE1S5Q1_9SOLA|nr:hypothetical protein RND71_018620 [Anisodus tanguticus]
MSKTGLGLDSKPDPITEVQWASLTGPTVGPASRLSLLGTAVPDVPHDKSPGHSWMANEGNLKSSWRPAVWVRTLVGAICSFLGLINTVVTVKNAEDALRILRTRDERFDLVLTDVYMPEMNGFELQQVEEEGFLTNKVEVYLHTSSCSNHPPKIQGVTRDPILGNGFTVPLAGSDISIKISYEGKGKGTKRLLTQMVVKITYIR